MVLGMMLVRLLGGLVCGLTGHQAVVGDMVIVLVDRGAHGQGSGEWVDAGSLEPMDEEAAEFIAAAQASARLVRRVP